MKSEEKKFLAKIAWNDSKLFKNKLSEKTRLIPFLVSELFTKNHGTPSHPSHSPRNLLQGITTEIVAVKINLWKFFLKRTGFFKIFIQLLLLGIFGYKLVRCSCELDIRIFERNIKAQENLLVTKIYQISLLTQAAIHFSCFFIFSSYFIILFELKPGYVKKPVNFSF